MRFLCDVMLERLARWLRAAGHDAISAKPGEGDRALVGRAEMEDRLLLTRDRALARATGRCGLLVEGEDTEAQALFLGRRLGLDWTFDPFTRCVIDNTPLEPAQEQDIRRMPEKARALDGPFNVCPACRRLYWPGSHVKRMAARLERLAIAQRTGA